MSSIIFQFPCRDGLTGLELESVRHHYSSVTPSYGCRLANAVLEALDESARCAEAELHAATKIQATFRMHLRATSFREVRHKACTIQRFYRGYATRKRLALERTTVEQLAYLKMVFDVFATKIQASYRGYRSRKTTFNYYAQQAYIHQVTSRSLGVLQDAHRTRAEQDKLRAAEAQRLHALTYARRTAEMHHTVSTFATPSVYLRPPAPTGRLAQTLQTTAAAQNSGGTAKAVEDYELEQVAVFTAGEKLEDDIRQNSRAARRANGDDAAGKPASVTASSSPRPNATASKVVPEDSEQSAGSSPSTNSASRLPNIAAASRKSPAFTPARTAGGQGMEKGWAKPAQAVPWEDAAATTPQRPLLPRSHSKAATNASSAAAADGVANSVSSFNRKFGVRRHDCVEHDINCHAGSSRKVNSSNNGGGGGGVAAATTFPGPLSTAKEKAALERSVNHKLVKSVHGDAVFTIPAGRGKRS